MKSFIILSVCIALCAAQSPYSFGYQTADGQSRQETGHGGAVTGAYSYIDANGDPRQVRYVADANGFRAEGDVSVDRRTAAAADAIAAQQPRAVAAAPVAHWNAAPAVHWNAAPAPHWNAAPVWGAAPLVAHLSQPLPSWHVSPRAYQVETPTHKVYAQI